MPPWLTALIEEQRQADLVDLLGSNVSTVIRLTDRVINKAIAAQLPEQWPVSEVMMSFREPDVLDVLVRPRSSFLPHFRLAFEIARQPQLPDSPQLVLRLRRNRLTAIATATLNLFANLPAGISLQDHWLTIDLDVLARRHGLAEAWSRVTRVHLSSGEDRLTLSIDAEVSAARDASSIPNAR